MSGKVDDNSGDEMGSRRSNFISEFIDLDLSRK